MTRRAVIPTVLISCLAIWTVHAVPARADGDLRKVNHLVFMMQENRSFDNYFGALPYVPGGAYHPCSDKGRRNDHQCVDGLTCTPGPGGELSCSNFNLNAQGEKVFAFHNRRICGKSGLDHGWPASHHEAN